PVLQGHLRDHPDQDRGGVRDHRCVLRDRAGMRRGEAAWTYAPARKGNVCPVTARGGLPRYSPAQGINKEMSWIEASPAGSAPRWSARTASVTGLRGHRASRACPKK